MRKYETLFLIQPDLEEEQIKATIEKVSNLLKEQGAEIVSIDEWGLRKLAYEIQKYSEGYYVLINFDSEPKVVEELERVSKLDIKILRFMTVERVEKTG